MDSIQCPACRVRIARRPGLVSCPGCGARLKKKKPPTDHADDAPRKKKKRKKKGSGPNYAMLAAAGGGFAILAAVAVVVAVWLGDRRRPAAVDYAGGGAGGAGGVVQAPEPKWAAQADPPKGNIRPKDDLAIALGGDPVFAVGFAPFVADLEAAGARPAGAPGLAVYDLRTGQRTGSGKAIALPSSGGTDATDRLAALGPDGKTLAVRTITTTGTGRQRSVATEAVIYRVGQDAPVMRVPTGNFVPWMAFGRDEDQLIVLSAPPQSAISLTAYDLKKPLQAPAAGPNGTGLEIPNMHIRWRNGMGPTETIAISPGRNYLAFGEGRSVDLVRLADLKWAGKFDLPGDCHSVAFSADGSELAVHSIIAPPKKSSVAAVNQWSTFSLADGKLKTQEQVKGGVAPGPILAAGPKPGLAVHGTRDRALVADTRVGAEAYSATFHAVRCFDADRLLGVDPESKQLVVRRIDPEQLAAGVKKLADIFGPRPAPDAADRSALAGPVAPTGWAVPLDAAGEPPALVDSQTVTGGADFVMPWPGKTALSALAVRRVGLPRDRYTLEWSRIDLAGGKEEGTFELWPSLLPPGEVPMGGGSGGLVADHTADGGRLAVRDAATPARVDVWDKTGKRLSGFLPYGEGTPVDGLAWVADDRLITRGGGKVTGWAMPGRKAVYEFSGYVGAHALSPGGKWIALQSDKSIDVYDATTGKPLGRLEQGNPGTKPWHGFAVSRDGAQLAAVELVRVGQESVPGIWAVATWDLRTGRKQEAYRLFGGFGNRAGHALMWLSPRLLLAGGADVIDLVAKATTATLGLALATPLPGPDGRYWGAPSNPGRSPEFIGAKNLTDTVQSLPRPAAADVVFKDGTTVELVGETGDNGRDAVARSLLGQALAAEGYPAGRSDWKLKVSGKKAEGVSGYLETPSGGKIAIPFISGKVQLIEPGGTVAWEGSASGGVDLNHSKYKTSKEQTFGPGGGSITHFNFGFRDPGEAMAEEAWDNFMEGLKAGGGRFPRVLARVNGKLTPLPIAVPVK